MNEYVIEEWSVDTRVWVIKSDRRLTEEEVEEIYYDGMHMDEGETEDLGAGATVTYKGTRYGDDCQIEIMTVREEKE